MAEALPPGGRTKWWSALNRPTRLLVVWAVLQLTLMGILPVVVRAAAPAFAHVRGLLLEFSQGRDSWYAMLPAYLYTLGGDPGQLYTELFFDQELKFQYPPTSLLPLAAFDASGLVPAYWHLAFMGISYAMVVLAVVAMVGVTVGCLRQSAGGPRALAVGERWVIGACALIALVTFYPLTKGVSNGNVHLWISALTIAAMACWIYGRRRCAGVALGLGVLLKPHFGAFLLWGLVRRQWGFTGALAATMAFGLGLSVARFGVASHIAYLDTVRFMARHGEAFVTNQSLLGMLHRALDGRVTTWHLHEFPPFRPEPYVASMTFAALVVALALVLPTRGDKAGGALDFGVMILTVTLASPIAWHAHYGTVIALFPVLFARVVAQGYQRPISGAVIAVSYLAIAHAWAFDLSTESTLWNGFHSEVFIPALVLLAFCHRECLRPG